MLKTGFLLPRSTVYPLIGHDFMDGFKSFSREDAEERNIVSENIGFGIDEAEVYAKNEGLLLKENADIVIAFMDGRSAEMIQPLFTATGKILLLVNMGAHFSAESTAAGTTINHTFNIAFNSWLTGKLASDLKHPTSFFTTSYYDGGYLQCFCMATRYLKDGNTISGNLVTPLKNEEFNSEGFAKWLDENPGLDSLLCLFSGDSSPMMYDCFSKLQEKKDLHFFVSPMMLDESLKQALPADLQIKNVKGYTAWNSGLDNSFNKRFMDGFRNFSGREPNMFSLLGWETAMIVHELEALYDKGLKGAAAVKELMKMKLNSPRGYLQFDEKTKHSFGPAHLVTVDGSFSPVISETLTEFADEQKAFNEAKPAGAASGWRNTYLCS